MVGRRLDVMLRSRGTEYELRAAPVGTEAAQRDAERLWGIFIG